MIFLRYSFLALEISALVSVFLVARTFLLSPPRVFLIFLLSSFSGFLFGFLLGRIADRLSLWLGSYLTRYCWLSQARTKPMDRLPPKAVLNPKRTRFFSSHLYLLEMSCLRSFWETLGLPSWKTSRSSSFLARSLFTLSFLVLMVTVINQWLNQYFTINLIYLTRFIIHMIHSQSKPISVVLDIGSYFTYAGFAGDESPRFATHSYLTTDTNIKDSEIITKCSIGDNEFREGRAADKIQSIFQDANEFGQVTDFHFEKEKLQNFIEVLLGKNLDLIHNTISIVIAEDIALKPTSAVKQREHLAEFLFEELDIESLTFMKKPMLTCFSLGRSSGLVLDSGHSFTRASVVEDGFPIYNQYVHYGGGTITGQIGQLVDEKHSGWKTLAEDSTQQFLEEYRSFQRMYQLQKIKHSFESLVRFNEDQIEDEDNQIQYKLPDGNTLNLSRQQIVDPFTQYSNFFIKYLQSQGEQKGIKNMFPSFINPTSAWQEIAYKSLDQLVIDTTSSYLDRLASLSKNSSSSHSHKLVEKDLYQSIILTGGNFLYGDLASEVKRNLNKKMQEKVNTILSPVYLKKVNENSSSWVGGSIVADLATFNHFWVSKKEWNEGRGVVETDLKKINLELTHKKGRNHQGMSLLNKKCP